MPLLKSKHNSLSPSEGFELHLYCHADECVAFAAFAGSTKGQAWGDSHRAGWVKRANGVVLCPNHKGTRFTGRQS